MTAPGHSAPLGAGAGRAGGPVQGFGRLWRKTYLVRLEHARATPAEVTAVWRRRFSEAWRAQARSWVAGSSTFSAYDDDGVTVAQVQLLMRARDPCSSWRCCSAATAWRTSTGSGPCASWRPASAPTGWSRARRSASTAARNGRGPATCGTTRPSAPPSTP